MGAGVREAGFVAFADRLGRGGGRWPWEPWASPVLRPGFLGLGLSGLSHWLGQPGTGLLLAALAVSTTSVTRDLRAAWAGPASDIDWAE
jgi:hypothetical protein